MFGAIFSHQRALRNIWPYRWKIVSLFLCLFSVVCFFFSHNKAIVPQLLVMLQYSELEIQILTQMWGCDPAGGGNMKSEPSRSEALQITEGSYCSSSTWHWCHPDMLGSYCERAKLKEVLLTEFTSCFWPSRNLYLLIYNNRSIVSVAYQTEVSRQQRHLMDWFWSVSQKTFFILSDFILVMVVFKVKHWSQWSAEFYGGKMLPKSKEMH